MQSLSFAQCHKKEQSYVDNEAGPQCDLIIHGRISSQNKLPHNFLKSRSQHIQFPMQRFSLKTTDKNLSHQTFTEAFNEAGWLSQIR